MPKGISFLDMLNAAAAKCMTKEEFGKIIRDGTEDEREDAVRRMNELGGYECLGDD